MVTFWGKSILLFHFVKLSSPLLQQSKSSEMTHQETPRKSNEGLFGCVLSALNIVRLAWLNYMNYIVYLKANSPTRMNWSRHILKLNPNLLNSLKWNGANFQNNRDNLLTQNIHLYSSIIFSTQPFCFHPSIFSATIREKNSDKNKIRDGYYISGIQLCEILPGVCIVCSLVPFISNFVNFLLTRQKLAVMEKSIVFSWFKW